MKHIFRITLLAAALAVTACASKSPAPQQRAQAEAPEQAAADEPTAVTVKSRDGSYEGEITGKAAPGSKFAKLEIGMNMEEVQTLLGHAPDRMHTYESGKRWIPFYFGNDARRMQALFKGEGCLIFTDGNIWGGAGGDLIGINNDPSGACYKE